MKRTKLLLILAILVALTMVIAACDKDCAHETYGDWKITKAPTSDATGEAIRVCASCGVAETATLAKLSDASVWTATSSTATHTSAGKIVYTSTYGSVEVFVDRLDDHVYDKEVATDAFLVSAADCTHAAVYRKSCVCGAVDTATFTHGNLLGHDGKPVNAVEAVHTATTLVNGTKAHYECDRCGKLFSDAACEHEVTAESLVVVAAHAYGDEIMVKAPTCTEAGSSTHSCSVCGKTETITLAQLGHVYVGGIIVPVNPDDDNQVWDGSEADEEGQDVPSSTTHARVCDVCHAVDVDNAVAHNYTGAEEQFFINAYDNTVYSTVDCVVCGHTAEGPTKVTGVIKEYTVVTDESKPATYTETGYTTYSNSTGSLKFKVVEPKLVAPYEGKTYMSLEIERKENKTSADAQYTLWEKAIISVDSIGTATGTSSPFRGNVVITMVDSETGEITLTVGNTVFDGFVEPLTGVMVISDDGFNSVYVVSPYEMTRDSAVASYWNRAIAIDYHIDCGTYLGHNVGIFVNDDEVLFGVSFEDANGKAVAANECYSQDVLVIKDSDGSVIVTYVKNSNGVLQAADELRGTYTAANAASDWNLGSLVVDGIGGFVLPDAEAPSSSVPLSGRYTARQDGKFDAYVIIENADWAYFIATIDTDTMTYVLDPQQVTLTVHVGSNGTIDGETTVKAFVNCIVADLPSVSPATGYAFLGWYTKDGTGGDWGEKIDETFTFDQDADVYAKLVLSVDINFSGVLDGDETSHTYGDGETIVSGLPAYVKDETINSVNNTIFAGWFTDSALETSLDYEAVASAEDANATIYAKWIPAGTWTIAQGPNYGFVYDNDLVAWKNNNKSVHNSDAIMNIIANNGPIFVSFNYTVNTEGSDKLTVRHYYNAANQDNTVVIDGIGGENKTGTYAVTLQAGCRLYLVYHKDSSVDRYGDTVCISSLVINGRTITLSGTVDFLEGTYTSAGQDDLVLNGYGAFTWGTKEGTYAKAAEGYDMYVVDGGKNTEYYVLTLDTENDTYTVTKTMVDVSFNFGGVSGSLDPINVNANIEATLPAGPAIDGYVFRGWYDNAELTGNAITSVTPSADTTVYAKYDAAVTLTYNYGEASVEDKVVSMLFVNDKIGELESIGEVAVEGKVFVGWFLKNEEEWGDEVTANTVITENLTVYAKWVTPHALMGEYKGANLDPAESGIANEIDNSYTSALSIDAFGNVTGWKSGVIEDYDSANGTFVLNVNGTKYHGAANVNVGILYVDYASGKTNAYHDIQFFGKTVGEVNIANTIDTAWDKGCTKLVVITYTDDSIVKVLIKDRIISVVNSWTARKADGTAITDVNDLAANVDYLSIVIGEQTLAFARLDSNLVATDGTEGTYSLAGSELTVILNGAGGIAYNGKSGTLTAVEGQENTYTAVFADAAYTLTIDVTAKTYTIAENKVTISYDFGTLEGSLDDETVYVGVSHTLPSAPAIDGYVFRGWYDDAEFTGSAKTSVTPAGNTVIYAKYDKAITVTVIYGNGISDGSVTDKFANDKVTVALPEPANHLYPVGWYTTATFDEGTEWTSGSVVTDDLTVYCKWIAPHALMGTYKGWEAYQGKWQNSTLKTLTIDAIGKVTGTAANGTITGYDPTTGNFTIVSGSDSRIGYYESASNTIIIGFSSSQSALNDDVYILFSATSETTLMNNSGTSYAARWKSGGSAYDNYVVFAVINGITKYVYRDATKVYVDVDVKVNNVAVTTATLKDATTKDNVLEISRGGLTLFKGKYDGTTFIGQDGKQGTYTGTIGTAASITVDGYGMVTIGDDTVAYTLDDSKITFVLNNRTMVVELGDGTCAQVQDGLAGTYTLPDGVETIVLDGLGGAGEGATYVVNGANITIYTAGGSTNYGLDVANKELLGKSKFAGLTFTGTYKDNSGSSSSITIIFDDDVSTKGIIYAIYGTKYYFNFTAELNGNTLVFTFGKCIDSAATGKTLTATISGDTMTFTACTISNGSYTFANDGSATCSGFSL